ncbi:hypothetical protein [Ruegeria sp. SCP11]|uniref:hypothetical protein n=1 Tax=Ruegeria sp. SCP11 TaxID=3141378 RepID=UPI0033387465
MKYLIGCPTRRGLVHFKTALTMQTIVGALATQGHSCSTTMVAGADVVEARNRLATQFVASDCDWMIGIDDDIGVSPDVALGMIKANLDYVGVCIPPRQLDLEMFAQNIRNGMSDRDAQLHAAPLIDGAGLPDGISPVERVGTGFFVLRKTVLERILASGNVTKKVSNLPGQDYASHGFYDCLIDDNGGRLSEDYSFCKRARASGIPIHAYKGQGITHSGEMTFSS